MDHVDGQVGAVRRDLGLTKFRLSGQLLVGRYGRRILCPKFSGSRQNDKTESRRVFNITELSINRFDGLSIGVPFRAWT